MSARLGKLFLMGLTAFLVMAAIRVNAGTTTASRNAVEHGIESKLNAIARQQINDKAWLSLQLQGTGASTSLALDSTSAPQTYTKGTIYLYADGGKKIDTKGINLMMRSEVNRTLGYPVELKIEWIAGVTTNQSAPSSRSVAFINFMISLTAGLAAAAIAWLYQRRTEKKAWLATGPERSLERSTVALPGQSAPATVTASNEAADSTTEASEASAETTPGH